MVNLIYQSETQFIKYVGAAIFKGNWRHLSETRISSCFTPSDVSHILLQLSFDGSISLAFFKWMESLPDYTHSLQPYWTMIHILTRKKQFQIARNLIERIAFKDFLSSPAVLSSLINNHGDTYSSSQVLSCLVMFYAQKNLIEDALEIFNQMKKCGMTPHLHACSQLLNSLVKSGLTAMAWKVYGEMLRSGIRPNSYIFNCMLHSCSKSGEVEKATTLLDNMEQEGVHPDLFSYNTLISMFCKKGMHYEALDIQERMERNGISPDIVTYNSLLYGFCREGRMREASRFFKEIKSVNPNLVTYTTLIDGYCRVNDMDEAFRLLKEMEAKGLYPGVVTYNSILRKFCEQGKIRAANDLLNEMSEKNVKPDNVTGNTLVNAYCKRGNMGCALRIRNQMLDAGFSLDQFTYKALIHGFCKVKKVEDAKQILLEMIDSGISPNYNTYSWIIDAYIDQNNGEEVLHLPEKLLKRHLCLDTCIYRAIIRRFCKKGMVSLAQRAFSEMQSRGLSGDSLVLSNLAYAFLQQGQTVAASNILDEMVRNHLMITRKIYTSLISYSDSKETFKLFWDHAVDKGLVSKYVIKQIQQQYN